MKPFHKRRILFLLRKRCSTYGVSYGLVNSARLMCEALRAIGHECRVEIVTDGNDVDREVTRYNPTHVIIEALWVTPLKLAELVGRYHRQRHWVVRIHSDAPFLATEGMAVQWIREYARQGDGIRYSVKVGCNSIDLADQLRLALEIHAVYLPNAYPRKMQEPTGDHDESEVRIGCFGAIRPLKNHLVQAMAAMKFADMIGRRLKFYVNAELCEETGGSPILSNLRALFAHTGHDLVGVTWLDHDAFTSFVRSMDVGMQVSLTETFNLVAADMVAGGVPVIGSPSIHWLDGNYKAEPNDIGAIVRALQWAWKRRAKNGQQVNQRRLMDASARAVHVWQSWLEE